MQTIYEKESMYGSVDALYTEIKAYVDGAVGREELHEVELGVFRRVLTITSRQVTSSTRHHRISQKPRDERGAFAPRFLFNVISIKSRKNFKPIR